MVCYVILGAGMYLIVKQIFLHKSPLRNVEICFPFQIYILLSLAI